MCLLQLTTLAGLLVLVLCLAIAGYLPMLTVLVASLVPDFLDSLAALVSSRK